MIQRLRRHFVLINMLCVSAVLVFVFAVLLFFTVRDRAAQLDNALELAAGLLPPPNDALLLPPEDARPDAALLPAFAIEIAPDGTRTLLHVHYASVTDAYADQAADLALADGRSRSYLPALDLCFLRLSTSQDSTVIAFVEISSLRHPIFLLLLLSLLAFTCAILLFLALSLRLARSSLRPVEEAWRQQRQFAADASHELKTPLSAIRANTGVLLSHPEATIESQRKWLEYIQTETSQMEELVDQLLFLARADQLEESPQWAECDLSELLQSCLLTFESRFFEAGLTVESDLEPRLTLPGETEHLRRLIDILLDNACKYTPAGGRVAVRLRREEPWAVLSLSNFGGEPIPPDAQARLFERFYRVSPSRARSEGGYGLGLSIAKAVADRHKGQISLHSTEADGTAFTVRLPLRRAVD